MSDLTYSERLDLGGNQIHVVGRAADEFEIWLNTEVTDFDGLCIRCGETQQEAVRQALELLGDAMKALRGASATSPATSAAGGE